MGAALAQRVPADAIAFRLGRLQPSYLERQSIMTALMYHDVVPAGAEDSSGFPGRDAALYKITPELFESHLAVIRECGDIAITFDDGGASAMRAADGLERQSLAGLFFVTANYIGTRG